MTFASVLPWIIPLVALFGALVKLVVQIAKIYSHLERLNEHVETLRKEFAPNHGSSLKDAVTRLESKLNSVEERLTAYRDIVRHLPCLNKDDRE